MNRNLAVAFLGLVLAAVAAWLVGSFWEPGGGRADAPRVYVACSAADQVVGLDPFTHEIVERLQTDDNPIELTLDPEGRRLYVSNSEADTVQVFERRTGALLARYRTPRQPSALGVSPDGTLLRVAHIRGDLDTVIHLEPLPEQAPEKPLTVDSPRAERVKRTAVEFSNLKTTEVSGRAQPRGRDFFLGQDVRIPEVLVTDARTRAVRSTIPVGVEPSMILMAPSEKEAYVVVRRENCVAVIDVDRLEVVKKVPVGKGPARMILVPGGRHLYVMNTDGDTLSVMDTRTREVVRTVTIGGGSLGAICWPPDPRAPAWR